MSEEYNGYPNRSTWLANLHLSNDEGTYDYVTEYVHDNSDDLRDVAAFLEDYVFEWMAYDESVRTDMSGAGTDHVDWEHLARLWIEDADQ